MALRGGTGRPDVATLAELFEQPPRSFGRRRTASRLWFGRIGKGDLDDARAVLARLSDAVAPLAACRGRQAIPIAEIARTTIVALEALARDEAGGTDGLYERDAGEKFAGFFRALIAAATADFAVSGDEWPDIAAALIAAEIVKPAAGGDGRVAIWGALEARLQTVGTLVVGGLNEGSWPRRAEPDRFMSRMMKGGLELEPPERRIGLAAHDFMMAMGHERIVLARAARSGDAPATASRWLQRLLTFAGPEQAGKMRARGDDTHRLGAQPRCRRLGEIRAAPEPGAAARRTAEEILGDRDRDAAARSLCGLCAPRPWADAARPAAARPRRCRARQSVPRHHCAVSPEAAPIRRTRTQAKR